MIGTPGRIRAATDEKKQGRNSTAAWHEQIVAESTTTEEISDAEVKGQWQRVKPRPWDPQPLEAYQRKNEECSHKHLQFMQTQFPLRCTMTLTEVARRQSVWIDGQGGIRPLEEPRTSRQAL